MIKASGYGYNPVTREWDIYHSMEFDTRIEAIRCMNFQRDWMKCLKIED